METVCLLAGAGKLPQNFVDEANKRGIKVFRVGVKGVTDHEADVYLPMGKVGRLVKLLKERGIKKITMLGKFEHRYIYTELLRFDFKALSLLRRAKDRKPASLIKAFIGMLEEEGFEVFDPKPVLESILANEGKMGNLMPGKSALEDGRFGFGIAKEVAQLDVGQTIVVKDMAVVAVEAMEGTQETIKRAGKLAGKGCRVVKVARKEQDFRIDVPTVGEDTLKAMKSIKADTLFLEAGKVFIIDKPSFLSLADSYGIAVYGL